jgi:protease-4
MKQFLQTIAATMLGFLGFTVLLGGVGMVILIISNASNPSAAVIANKSVLVFDLNTTLRDAPTNLSFSDIIARVLNHKASKPLTLRSAVRAIDAAATDPRIAGLLLRGNFDHFDSNPSLASLREVRDALQRFRSAGKRVIAYQVVSEYRDYYLCSTASEIVLSPMGRLILPGLSVETLFFGEAFQKFGIGVQVARAGKYKAFVEQFTSKQMSPENKEQLQAVLDDSWNEFASAASKSRNLEITGLTGLCDTHAVFSSSLAVENHLVDKVAYYDAVLEELKNVSGARPGMTIPQINLTEYATQNSRPRAASSPIIAIVYAEGEIVDGEGSSDEVGGERFARLVRDLRNNERVKAIVLRVNSPGGSADASDAIQRELKLTLERKPVVISMGDVAASGGYWISSYSSRVFAQPTTVTGSIGVFGLVANIKDAGAKIGLTWDSVQRGRYAQLFSLARPKTDLEMSIHQTTIDEVYDQFLARVAGGRKLELARVKEIGQGRIWSGQAALNLKLVDELGGLDAAVIWAARESHVLENYEVREFPRPSFVSTFVEAILPQFPPAARTSTVDQAMGEVTDLTATLKGLNSPSQIYARMPFTLRLR